MRATNLYLKKKVTQSKLSKTKPFRKRAIRAVVVPAANQTSGRAREVKGGEEKG